jgi:hypothetical protein
MSTVATHGWRGRSETPPIPAIANVSAANVKGTFVPGDRSNRRLLRGFTV